MRTDIEATIQPDTVELHHAEKNKRSGDKKKNSKELCNISGHLFFNSYERLDDLHFWQRIILNLDKASSGRTEILK